MNKRHAFPAHRTIQVELHQVNMPSCLGRRGLMSGPVAEQCDERRAPQNQSTVSLCGGHSVRLQARSRQLARQVVVFRCFSRQTSRHTRTHTRHRTETAGAVCRCPRFAISSSRVWPNSHRTTKKASRFTTCMVCEASCHLGGSPRRPPCSTTGRTPLYHRPLDHQGPPHHSPVLSRGPLPVVIDHGGRSSHCGAR
jgi:hypothetical protein